MTQYEYKTTHGSLYHEYMDRDGDSYDTLPSDPVPPEGADWEMVGFTASNKKRSFASSTPMPWTMRPQFARTRVVNCTRSSNTSRPQTPSCSTRSGEWRWRSSSELLPMKNQRVILEDPNRSSRYFVTIFW